MSPFQQEGQCQASSIYRLRALGRGERGNHNQGLLLILDLTFSSSQPTFRSPHLNLQCIHPSNLEYQAVAPPAPLPPKIHFNSQRFVFPLLWPLQSANLEEPTSAHPLPHPGFFTATTRSDFYDEWLFTSSSASRFSPVLSLCI